MFNYALLYVKRCQAAMGTTRYSALKKTADELIDALDSQEEQEQLRELLSKSLAACSLEIQNPILVEKEYWKYRDNYHPLFVHEIAKATSIIAQNIQNLLCNLYWSISLFEHLYTTEKSTTENREALIIEIYDGIEKANAEFSYLLSDTEKYTHKLLNPEKYICLLNLIQVLYYLCNEYPSDYAYRYLPGLPRNAPAIAAGDLFTLVEAFSHPANVILDKKAAIFLMVKCKKIYDNSRPVFDYLRIQFAQHRSQSIELIDSVFSFMAGKEVDCEQPHIHHLYEYLLDYIFSHKTRLAPAAGIFSKVSEIKAFYTWALNKEQPVTRQKELLEYTLMSLSALKPPMNDPFVKEIMEKVHQQGSDQISRFFSPPSSSSTSPSTRVIPQVYNITK